MGTAFAYRSGSGASRINRPAAYRIFDFATRRCIRVPVGIVASHHVCTAAVAHHEVEKTAPNNKPAETLQAICIHSIPLWLRSRASPDVVLPCLAPASYREVSADTLRKCRHFIGMRLHFRLVDQLQHSHRIPDRNHNCSVGFFADNQVSRRQQASTGSGQLASIERMHRSALT